MVKKILIILMLLFPFQIKAETTKRPSAEIHFKTGVKSLILKDADRAIKSFTECLKTDSSHLRCSWEMGWAYYLKGHWSKSVEYWENTKGMLLAVDMNKLDEAKKKKYTEIRNVIEDSIKTVRQLKKLPIRIESHKRSSSKSHEKEIKSKDGQRVIKIRAVGDVMMGSDFPANYLPSGSNRNILRYTKKYLKNADITFANLESSFCSKNSRTDKCSGDLRKCYAFRTPLKFLDFIKESGIDLVSLANNHANDFGENCRIQTERRLNDLDIKWSGRPGTYAHLEIKNAKIAMIAFHYNVSSNYLNDHLSASRKVKELSDKHDILIVSAHWGAEGLGAIRTPKKREIYFKEDRGNTVEFARLMIDSGADIVLGHGPHVVRAIETYKNRLIAYSLGNFLTYGRFSLHSYLKNGVILEANLDNNGQFLWGRLIPTVQKSKGIAYYDKQKVSVDLIRALTKEDFPESRIDIALDGTFVQK